MTDSLIERSTDPEAEEFELDINGALVRICVPANTPLLYALRNHLGLKAAKFGCGLEQCYACAVIVDGIATPTCATGVDAFVGKQIRTLEGLGSEDRLDPVQQAFMDEHAGQCGYCIPGMIMSVRALLDRVSRPDDAEVAEALDRHLCRCGCYSRIRRAVHRAARA